MMEFLQSLLGGIFNFGILPGMVAPGDRTKAVLNLITNSLILLFVAIIVVAIVYAALAGLKYIRSQGEEDKVEEAQKALKAVLFGVAAVFIGIIGVIIITSIFTSTNTIGVREALCTFLEPNQVEACVQNS